MYVSVCFSEHEYVYSSIFVYAYVDIREGVSYLLYYL